MVKVVTVTTFLEMESALQGRLDLAGRPGVEVTRAVVGDAPVLRSMCLEIGREHLWVSRIAWTDGDFERLLADGKVHVWIAREKRTPVGFIELSEQERKAVKMALLGIRPAYAGRGMGRYLLSFGIAQAWGMGAERVRVETRTYDGERALNNYLQRGFKIKKRRPEIIVVPERYDGNVTTIIQRARERGVFPSPLRRLEAYVRAFCRASAVR